jgi:hypothetical protein
MVPYPYPVYPQPQPFRPYPWTGTPYPSYPRPFWTTTSGSSAQPPSGGTNINFTAGNYDA